MTTPCTSCSPAIIKFVAHHQIKAVRRPSSDQGRHARSAGQALAPSSARRRHPSLQHACGSFASIVVKRGAPDDLIGDADAVSLLLALTRRSTCLSCRRPFTSVTELAVRGHRCKPEASDYAGAGRTLPRKQEGSHGRLDLKMCRLIFYFLSFLFADCMRGEMGDRWTTRLPSTTCRRSASG